MSTDFKLQFNSFYASEFSDQDNLIPNYLRIPREYSLRKQGGKLTRTRGNLRRFVRNGHLLQSGDIRFRRYDLRTFEVGESRRNDIDIVPSLQGKAANNVAFRCGNTWYTATPDGVRAVAIKKMEKPPISRESSGERFESLKRELILPSLQGRTANNVAFRRGDTWYTATPDGVRAVTIKKVEKPPITRESSGERVESLKRELIARFEGILKMYRADLEPRTMHSQELNSLVEEVVKKVIKNKALGEDQGGRKSNAMRVKEGTGVAPGRERDEAMQDPNYRAYLRDAPKLSKDLGKCVVAYSNGERVAVGRSRREVMNKIPAEYKDNRILIQEVPDRVIKSHRPFRVRR